MKAIEGILLDREGQPILKKQHQARILKFNASFHSFSHPLVMLVLVPVALVILIVAITIGTLIVLPIWFFRILFR